MSSRQTLRSAIGIHEVGFVIACLLSTALVLPLQVVSMIFFDSTGLDTAAPTIVFMAVVPAVVTALIPTSVALRYYHRRRALAVAGTVLLVNVTIAVYLTQFYRICGGPNC